MPRAELRAQLIDIAQAHFATNGYSGTTMESVAEAAGITKPVIHDLFGSKEGLLTAIVDYLRGELEETLRQSWREADPADGVRGVYRAGLVASFGFMDTHATAWRATLEDSSFLADPTAMNALRAAQIDTVMTGLRHQETLSEVPDFMLEGFAQGVIGACERIVAWRISQPQCTAEMATELVMALTWSGLERIAATNLPARASSKTLSRAV